VPARNPHVLAAIGVVPVGVCGPSDDRCDLTRRTKLIHHAIRMPAFNTAQSLTRAIATGTGYARADDEAHALIRTALAAMRTARWLSSHTGQPGLLAGTQQV